MLYQRLFVCEEMVCDVSNETVLSFTVQEPFDVGLVLACKCGIMLLNGEMNIFIISIGVLYLNLIYFTTYICPHERCLPLP